MKRKITYEHATLGNVVLHTEPRSAPHVELGDRCGKLDAASICLDVTMIADTVFGAVAVVLGDDKRAGVEATRCINDFICGLGYVPVDTEKTL